MDRLSYYAQKILKRILIFFYPDERFARKSYSQEGEDLILTSILSSKNQGFYVDIGAHHPFRFSNTYFFYKRGWRGINIDAMPSSMELFKKYRSKDINIECPIAQEETILNYYSFEEPALNTLSECIGQDRVNNKYPLKEIIPLKTRKLESVLSEYCKAPEFAIDFMSVDVEGLELEVLKSNDWSRFVPHVIALEILHSDWADICESKIYKYLASKGYKLHGRAYHSVFLVHQDFKKD